MIIKEQNGRVEYSVPLTSTFKFGLIYKPNGNGGNIFQGFSYSSIASLLKELENGPLPKLVCAMKTSDPNTPRDGVTKGEILLVKKVASNTSQSQASQLEVYSFKTGSVKYLHESCIGRFTTKPERVKLLLENIIKHIPDAFPMHVLIFPETIPVETSYQSHLFDKAIKMCRIATDVLLVASSVREATICDGREPFEIPQEIDLDLKVMLLPEADYQKLCKKSQQFHESVQGEYIKHYRNAHHAEADYVLQEMFLKTVTTLDDDYVNMSKHLDSAVYSHPNLQPKYQTVLSRLNNVSQRLATVEENVNECLKQDPSNESTLKAFKSEIEQQKGSLESTITDLKELTATVLSIKEASHNKKQYQEELEQLREENVSLRREMEEVGRELKKLKQQNSLHPSQLASLYQLELLTIPETAETNRKLLSTLTEGQV